MTENTGKVIGFIGTYTVSNLADFKFKDEASLRRVMNAILILDEYADNYTDICIASLPDDGVPGLCLYLDIEENMIIEPKLIAELHALGNIFVTFCVIDEATFRLSIFVNEVR